MKKNPHAIIARRIECYNGVQADPVNSYVRSVFANDNVFTVFRKPRGLMEQIKRILFY